MGVNLEAAARRVMTVARAQLQWASDTWRHRERLTEPAPAQPHAGAVVHDGGRPDFAAVLLETIRPVRNGRPDASRELAAITSAMRQTRDVLTAYCDDHRGVLNADSMSEFLNVHGATRWEHHDAVRSAAGALVQAAFEAWLRQPAMREDRPVIMMAGGNGAGKSTVANGLRGHLVLDSTLSDVAMSLANVSRARESGRSVLIVLVRREPEDAFFNGVLQRMLDPRNGRPVTVSTHARTHTRAERVVGEILESSQRDAGVAAICVSNRTGEAPCAVEIEWKPLPSPVWDEVTALETRLRQRLRQQVEHGRVPAAVAKRVDASSGY